MTSKINRMHGRGFTFVELLVALVIIAVGVAGLVSLQRTYLQSSVRAAERTEALEIAQERLELLRFTEFEDIASGTDTVTRGDKTYAVTWTAAPQYFNGVWLTTGDVGLPSPLPAQPDAKSVAIDISWTTRGGGAETVAIEAWLGSITGRDGGLVITEPAARSEPQVTYNPGAAPEVIAVRLTDDDNANLFQVKETTRPTPQVERSGDKLSVRFDTVTYDEATQTQRVEDFVTVNCSCTMRGFGEGATPSRLILEDGRLTLDPNGNQQVTKIYGEPLNVDQSELCTQCCRDHHDNSDMANAGVVYKQDDNRTPSGNHRHYTPENIFGFSTRATVGQNYEESCRMRRIDGYYAMYPDWQLQALTVTSAEYLINAAGAAAYTDYVRAVVRSLVLGTALPAPLSDRDISVAPGAYQMIGRGIYLDTMSSEHVQAVRTAINNNEADWISKVPFYEVNLTLLGEWAASQPTVASVTNQPIETIVDPENNYYGTYSRGRVQAQTSGQSIVDIDVMGGNAGVLGSDPLHPLESSTAQSSSLTVTVDSQAGDGGGTALFSVTGEVNCLLMQNGRYRSCTNRYYNSVSITTSDLNISCTYSKQGNADTGSYSCSGIPAGTSFTISFSSDAGGVFQPSTITVSDLQQNEQYNVLMTVD
ncbi:MAG TPA: prepilin-type N-terminal cleavage/methylation domain-containing protein [Pseudidiomarina sp.]|nr:prepilin-type N-terminal cleavage/methylation domain-containing protein [Pseudidiomarina sp.]